MIIEEIMNGYKNLVVKSPDIERLAFQRAKICSDCKELSQLLNFYMYCKKCGCYMPSKIRSVKSKCMLNKW